MGSYVVSESVLKQVLVTLYRRVVSKQEKTVIDLKRIKFHGFDRGMEQDVPQVVDKTVIPHKVQYASYILRMEKLGYIERKDMEFNFTEQGFLYASELAHPIKTAVNKYWQFFVGTTIALMALVVAIMQLK